jgi:DNA-binding CsgD family transcriptional regulator
MAQVLLSTSETAAVLGLTERSVRYLAEPSLEKVRVGRNLYFRESDVMALKARRAGHLAAGGSADGGDTIPDDT